MSSDFKNNAVITVINLRKHNFAFHFTFHNTDDTDNTAFRTIKACTLKLFYSTHYLLVNIVRALSDMAPQR